MRFFFKSKHLTEQIFNRLKVNDVVDVAFMDAIRIYVRYRAETSNVANINPHAPYLLAEIYISKTETVDMLWNKIESKTELSRSKYL